MQVRMHHGSECSATPHPVDSTVHHQNRWAMRYPAGVWFYRGVDLQCACSIGFDTSGGVDPTAYRLKRCLVNGSVAENKKRCM